MAQEIDRLSNLFVKRTKEPGYHHDGAGLYLQVSDTLTKSWIFRYTRNGKTREMGLGSLNTFTLAEARERARTQRKLLADGLDPIEARDAQKAQEALRRANVLSFAECAKRCIADRRDGWRNDKHIAQWSTTLQTYADPVIGKMPVHLIGTSQVLRVLQPIWTDKPETASRVRSRIENVLNWAKVHGYRDGDGENPARWRGNLDHILPKQSKVRRVKHHAALPYADINPFVVKLRKQPGAAPAALELLVLTATRTNEVRGATWQEIDFDKAIWVVPAERMKSAREHRVPLAPRALEILSALPQQKATDYVFPGRKPSEPMSNNTMLMTLERMGRGNVTVHGFRSCFKDWASETTNHPNIVSEMALAHVITSGVEAAYRRGDLFEKRKKLMLDWARFCDTPKVAGKVIPLKKKAK